MASRLPQARDPTVFPAWEMLHMTTSEGATAADVGLLANRERHPKRRACLRVDRSHAPNKGRGQARQMCFVLEYHGRQVQALVVPALERLDKVLDVQHKALQRAHRDKQFDRQPGLVLAECLLSPKQSPIAPIEGRLVSGRPARCRWPPRPPIRCTKRWRCWRR